MRYLALGDSYTIGEGVAEHECWPARLVRAWRQRGVEVESLRIIAQTGWSTDELNAALDAAGIDAEAAARPFDRVSLLIGVNNQYRGRSLDNYRSEFRALLARAIKLASGNRKHVFVVSIPDWGVTPFAQQSGRDRSRIAQDIDAFNAAAKSICKSSAVRFIDITGISRDRGGLACMLAPDRLHPGARMYARWVKRIEHIV